MRKGVVWLQQSGPQVIQHGSRRHDVAHQQGRLLLWADRLFASRLIFGRQGVERVLGRGCLGGQHGRGHKSHRSRHTAARLRVGPSLCSRPQKDAQQAGQQDHSHHGENPVAARWQENRPQRLLPAHRPIPGTLHLIALPGRPGDARLRVGAWSKLHVG